MFQEKVPFLDQQGEVVLPGDFVELLETRGGILKGPIKYEGFTYGTHRWSVGGGSFLTSAIESRYVRRLNWRRWRKLKERSEEFWGFMSEG